MPFILKERFPIISKKNENWSSKISKFQSPKRCFSVSFHRRNTLERPPTCSHLSIPHFRKSELIIFMNWAKWFPRKEHWGSRGSPKPVLSLYTAGTLKEPWLFVNTQCSLLPTFRTRHSCYRNGTLHELLGFGIWGISKFRFLWSRKNRANQQGMPNPCGFLTKQF